VGSDARPPVAGVQQRLGLHAAGAVGIHHHQQRLRLDPQEGIIAAEEGPLILRQGLQAQGIELGPVPFIQFCRVGAGDHIGDLTDCEVICLLVGERPGLVTNESMSAYLTYRPHTGIAESCRTVVSNIHRQGVSAVEAGAHIASLIGRILAQKASGIGLREDGA